MKTPLPDYLAHVIDACDIDNSGHLADYIPELANANPNDWHWPYPQLMVRFIPLGMMRLNSPFNRCLNHLRMPTCYNSLV